MTDHEWMEALFTSKIIEEPGRVVQAQRQVITAMAERDCMFDGAPLPHFLKPYFLSTAQTELLSRKATCLIGVLEKITRLYFSRPEFRTAFSLSRETAELIEIDPGYSRNIVISRPDAFLDGNRLNFIEFNCDSPAGAMYTDLEEDIFLEAYPMTALAASVRWNRYSRKRAALEALLACYADFGGKVKEPTIAIMDWDCVKTRHEFELLKKYFQDEGYPCVIVDPRRLTFKRGELYAQTTRVDIIYRRAIFYELASKAAVIQDLLRAYRERKVCMVNPLRSRLAANKSMLSILTNPNYDCLFTDEENAAKRSYIPWTRKLIDAEKSYDNRTNRLRELVIDNQDNMVLKPAEGYGGKGVSIGRETSKERWKQLTDQALECKSDWVVQEYVDIPETTVPLVEGDRVRLVSKKVNINPYIFDGRYAGGIARLSDQSVINVSAGGGLVPAISYIRNATDH